MDVKYVAFYLPQFHSIPENDHWWGKGFTEWERVKYAKPLFFGHKQPRKPYKYYDLTEISVLREQADLAKKYGIFGFCYYHYWFNGKKLLEKPLELMLENKDINIPFCLSWANEPWTRAWDGKPKDILIDQDYGNQEMWLKHLDYLIPFFHDERYIKIDGKPVFLIYRTESFSKFDKMIEIWKKNCINYGLKDIYIIETLTSYQKKPTCKYSDAVVEFEPMFSLIKTSNRYIRSLNSRLYRILTNKTYRLVNYDKLWKRIIRRNNNYNKTKFLGAFVDWDNTPRFKEKSIIFQGATPDKFKYYLLQQTKKCENNGSMLFINAWNEWAEGAYLEPDELNGYSFLEAIAECNNNFKTELNE